MKEFIKEIIGLIDPETRKGLLFLIGASIIALATLFCFAYVGSLPVVQTIALQLNLPKWVYGIALLIVEYILFVVISSDDTLYYGNPEKNRFTRAFQKDLPSKHLAAVLNVDIETAKQLWFDEFNKWGDVTHERHEDRQRTFQRGFSCRFVYYLWVVCRLLLALSVLWLGVEAILVIWASYEIPKLEAKLAIALLLIVFLTALGFFNRTSNTNPTGVWRRFSEINKRHCAWIDENIDLFKASPEGRKQNA